MSDNIPFDIQMEIIKKVSDINSLIEFRLVSKPWKSFIDSSDFINGYTARHTQSHSFILSCDCFDEVWYIRLVEVDNTKTFKMQELDPAFVPPLIKQLYTTKPVGTCHGLVCSFGRRKGYDNLMLVIWNPSIKKSFGIGCIVPKYVSEAYYRVAFGFGVSPVTSDPTVVKVLCADNMPWHVEVFTLSSGVWNVIPSANLPRQSIELLPSSHVVIDRFVYWGAREKTFTDDGKSIINYMVLSFDLIAKEFKVVDLPDCLTNELNGTCVFLSKLRESLVVYGTIYVDGAETCSLWVMQHDSSFKKLFSIGARVNKVLGFRESGEPLIETPTVARLHVYDPCSQQINNLGINGSKTTFVMGSYKESLLLLDHSDLHIYCDDF